MIYMERHSLGMKRFIETDSIDQLGRSVSSIRGVSYEGDIVTQWDILGALSILSG